MKKKKTRPAPIDTTTTWSPPEPPVLVPVGIWGEGEEISSENDTFWSLECCRCRASVTVTGTELEEGNRASKVLCARCEDVPDTDGHLIRLLY